MFIDKLSNKRTCTLCTLCLICSYHVIVKKKMESMSSTSESDQIYVKLSTIFQLIPIEIVLMIIYQSYQIINPQQFLLYWNLSKGSSNKSQTTINNKVEYISVLILGSHQQIVTFNNIQYNIASAINKCNLRKVACMQSYPWWSCIYI